MNLQVTFDHKRTVARMFMHPDNLNLTLDEVTLKAIQTRPISLMTLMWCEVFVGPQPVRVRQVLARFLSYGWLLAGF